MKRRMVKSMWHRVLVIACGVSMATACAHQQKATPEPMETPAAEEIPAEEEVPVEEENTEAEPEKVEETPVEEPAPEEPAGPEGEVAKRSADGIDDDNALPQPGPAREKFDLAIKEAQEKTAILIMEKRVM